MLPSATGALFGVLLVVMLAGATNYGNNLAFTLTFWLAAAALVSMHRAHRNLAGIELAAVTAEPVFAGQTAVFHVEITSRARLPRRGLALSGGATRTGRPLTVARDHAASAAVHAPTIGRGRLACSRLTITSRYPMGLFRCWSHASPTAHILVYPTPVDRLGRPVSNHTTGDGRAVDTHSGDATFAGHRRFQSGDSLRRIDWKASARTDDLLITEQNNSRAPAPWFDYAALGVLAPEARLSQLAFWVVEAEAAGHAYGLKLPRATLGPARGPAHRRACLEALALF
ncbi:DUF58 domain-containing protein [Salinisphaera sp.]|uniref:DUF58 domain-containing protein n=1 Tax=Salinisphaera sp. TaxID=1914330 RepID=UPI002D783DBE|nr:DUF58 domain-containing protein [Salinisphaera sp.]HET7315677.1 DUF58 domain-containing protein [Salinisphaera sp.]